MKIVLVGPVYPYRGGIAHYTTVLCQELRRANHEVLLVSFRRQYPACLFPGRTDKDPSRNPLLAQDAHYWLDALNPISWCATFHRVRRYHPDVIVLQWWTPYWAPAWTVLGQLNRRYLRALLVCICHNVLPHEQRWWDPAITRCVLSVADRVVAQSAIEAGKVLALSPKTEVITVPHPVYDMLATQTITRNSARAHLSLPETIHVLLYFGLVREYKGLRYLLEAMPTVCRQFPDARLLVVGEFWQDKRPYLQQIQSLGIEQNVIIVDKYVPNEEVPAYFAAADVVTLPYVDVTQSGVVQLAFGFGRPVITTRVGGLPEVVRDGENGVLVEPRNALALAHAIVSYLRGESVLPRREELLGIPDRGWNQLVQVVTRGRSSHEGVDSDES